jgi:uncharacterized protein
MPCLSSSAFPYLRQNKCSVYGANTFILRATPACSGGAVGCELAVMEAAVVHAAARGVAAYCAKFHQPNPSVIFEGVNPAVVTREWLRDAIEVFRRQMPPACSASFAMRTRGALLDEACLDLCAELGVSVCIRLGDPPFETTEGGSNAHGGDWYYEALAAIERVQHHPQKMHLFGGVLWVVNANQDSRAVYWDLRSTGVTNIDLRLPAGATWDHPPDNSASSTPFADCLISIFDEWWSENHPEVKISCFDKLLRRLVGSRVDSDWIGGEPLNEVIVHYDGGIEPIDCLRGSNGFAASGLRIQIDPVERLFQIPLFREAQTGQEVLCTTCRQCELRDICSGGYLPSRFRQSRGFDNPSVYCGDLMKLIHHVVGACTQELTVAV